MFHNFSKTIFMKQAFRDLCGNPENADNRYKEVVEKILIANNGDMPENEEQELKRSVDYILYNRIKESLEMPCCPICESNHCTCEDGESRSKIRESDDPSVDADASQSTSEPKDMIPEKRTSESNLSSIGNKTLLD